jgi:hypothetical protein
MSGSPRAAFGLWFAKNIIGKPVAQETIQTAPSKPDYAVMHECGNDNGKASPARRDAWKTDSRNCW